MKIKLTFILILSCSYLWAQDSIRVQKTKALFVGVGSGHYKGDLGDSYGAGQALFTIGIKLNTAKRLNGNFALNVGSVSEDELDYTFDDGSGISTNPNSYFKTVYFGLNYEAQYNIINKEHFKFYLSQGIGFFRFVPKDKFDTNLEDDTETRALNETYGNITIIFPTSIGVRYTLPNSMGIGFQTGFFNTVTDYIDNISDWGTDSGNDNIFNFRLKLYVPINL